MSVQVYKVITRVIASSSAGPEYLNGMRCLAMSEKYSLASWAVLVPKPGEGQQSEQGRVRSSSIVQKANRDDMNGMAFTDLTPNQVPL